MCDTMGGSGSTAAAALKAELVSSPALVDFAPSYDPVAAAKAAAPVPAYDCGADAAAAAA